MKILMIGCFDLCFHPYAEKYFEIFSNQDVKFIFWNRSGEKIENNKVLQPFNYKMNTYQPLLKKIKGYLLFRKYVIDDIKKNDYDKIIFFATQSMFLFGSIAKRKYKNKYVFDYRDITYEKYYLFKKYIESCIKFSYSTVVSSPGFINLFSKIDKNKFIICHNNKINFENVVIKKKNSTKIRLNYWGMVRQVKYLSKIFDAFGNDNRFEINIYGEGYENKLKKIIYKKKYSNIFIHGKYNQLEILDIAKNTDILINAYSNNSIQKNALTVKMYEGINFEIPMIIQKNSFMDAYLNESNYYHLSFDIDKRKINKDEIINNLNCHLNNEEICKKIKLDNEVFYDKIKEFMCL